MGVSSDGILVFGYNLGGDEGGWQIEEADEYGEFELEWVDEDGDFSEGAEAKLLAVAGFTETDWKVPGYFDRKREAQARVAVALESYCSGDYPMWLLAAHKVVARGDVKVVDFAALEALRAGQDWEGKLRAALAVLGITPKQDSPKWLLASYMG
jgi:hypothetical protein